MSKMIKIKNPVVGNTYHYWSRSVYELKPSLKRCTLISFNLDKGMCKVRRFDLTLNDIQTVEIKRLLEFEQMELISD